MTGERERKEREGEGRGERERGKGEERDLGIAWQYVTEAVQCISSGVLISGVPLFFSLQEPTVRTSRCMSVPPSTTTVHSMVT